MLKFSQKFFGSPTGLYHVPHIFHKKTDLEVLEYSRIFISNPEYQILFQNNLSGPKSMRLGRGLEC